MFWTNQSNAIQNVKKRPWNFGIWNQKCKWSRTTCVLLICLYVCMICNEFDQCWLLLIYMRMFKTKKLKLESSFGYHGLFCKTFAAKEKLNRKTIKRLRKWNLVYCFRLFEMSWIENSQLTHTHTRETERKTKLVFAIIKWCAQRIDKGYIYWFSVRPRDVLCFILLIQCIANVYYMTFSSPTCWNFGCIQYMHQYQVIMKCRRWCDRVSEAESKGKSGVSFNILSWF